MNISIDLTGGNLKRFGFISYRGRSYGWPALALSVQSAGSDETPFLELGNGKGVEIDTTGKPIVDPIKGGKDGGKPGPDLPKKDPEVIPPQAKVHAKVKGRFCPQAKNKLTVLFVVDYSGSMGRHVPVQGQAEIPGNDPQIAGSCGRLRAAQAIVSKIRAEKVPTDSVEIGMVPFAGGIIIAAKADGRWARAYDSSSVAEVPEDFLKALAKHKKAKDFFATLGKTNLYAITFRLQNSKKAETREKWITRIIAMLSRGEKVHL